MVFGDGPLPRYCGVHQLCPGNFFAFRVDVVDQEHFPSGKVGGMSIGFGISRLPARHRSHDSCVYAYEIPGSILVGYGAKIIDSGRWSATSWDPAVLEAGDVVGVLVGPQGDLTVFRNGQQVLRVATSLKDEEGWKEARLGPRPPLYPVVDLHGRVSSVTLLPSKAPPNVALRPYDRLRSC